MACRSGLQYKVMLQLNDELLKRKGVVLWVLGQAGEGDALLVACRAIALKLINIGLSLPNLEFRDSLKVKRICIYVCVHIEEFRDSLKLTRICIYVYIYI